jgi:DNA-binding LytR/AlgR family response regulator
MQILIVEDEAIIARRLRRLVRESCPRPIESIDAVQSIGQARPILEAKAVDVLFLDLNLRGDDGFDILEETAAEPYHTVVVSAYTDRAIEAFDVGVFDFVGKPFDCKRLKKTFARMFDATRRHHTGLESLVLHKQGRLVRIPVADVKRVEGAGSYARLVLDDGRNELHGKSLTRLLDLLPPTFFRIHRSHIARLDTIRRIRSREGSRYDVLLETGEVLPVGRTRVDDLRTALESTG